MRGNTQSRAVRLLLVFVLIACSSSFAQMIEDRQIPEADMSDAHSRSVKVTPRGHSNGMAHARFGIPNIDSLVNFNGQYFTDGSDPNGNPNRRWFYNMVGNPPEHKGTT